jgi:hypothetical protein
LSITFKNTSPKIITRVELRTKFLDPVAANSFSTTELGQRPAHALQSINGQPIPQTPGPPLLVQAGKFFTMPVIGDYSRLEAQIASRKVPMWDIRSIQVSFTFYYSDGAKWLHGAYYVPATKMGSYVPVTPQQFNDYQPSATE